MRSRGFVGHASRRGAVDVASRARDEVGLRSRRARPARKLREESLRKFARRNPKSSRMSLRLSRRATG